MDVDVEVSGLVARKLGIRELCRRGNGVGVAHANQLHHDRAICASRALVNVRYRSGDSGGGDAAQYRVCTGSLIPAPDQPTSDTTPLSEGTMLDFRPYETTDYRVNDLAGDSPQNLLLDLTGEPLPPSSGPGVAGLAEIAAALHRHASDMTAEQFEKVVWWVKDWKMHRSGSTRSGNSDAEFRRSMDALKATSEHRRYDRLARTYTWISHFAVVAALLMLTGAGAAWASQFQWQLVLTAVVGAGAFLLAATYCHGAVRKQWKEQDRSYFLQCLRLSRCTQDLGEAGLFQHQPDTKAVTKMRSADDMATLERGMRAMQLQLADAMYFDHDHYLRESAEGRQRAAGWKWPWPWTRKGPGAP